MTPCRTANLVVAITLSVGGGLASAQGSLDEAKSLYAAASYEDALEAIDSVGSGLPEREVRQFRALCLLALGRTDDADSELQAVVAADPLSKLDGDDVTPRMIAAFTRARRQVLPQVVRREFVEAKRLLLQEQDADQADAAFRRVVHLLEDPLLQDNSDLQDLRLVSAGFLDLLRFRRSAVDAPTTPEAETPAATTPPVETASVPGPDPEPSPVATTQDVVPGPAPEPVAAVLVDGAAK